jgi:putative acetyltransferase
MIKAQKLYTSYGFEFIDSSLGNTGHSSCTAWMLKKL